MGRRLMVAVLAAALTTAVAGTAGADDRVPRPTPTPGAPGVGDPYFPLDGNGGYDVDEYDLAIRYDPATDVLQGTATIRARATQALSSFNLDLVGLTVLSVEVNSQPAAFHRDGDELTVVPQRAVRDRSTFRVVVRYEGIPETVGDPVLGGISGFIHTDDGALVVGQPDVAATWYPVNDHPSDAASYRFDITVPEGLEAVANGVLTGERTRDGWTTWSWVAREPMASYLTTATIGEFELDAYREDGIRYWDALDPDLFEPPLTVHTGEQVLFSDAANSSYKRLTRTIDVPTGGATLTFWVARATELDWDYFFVEARTPDGSDWTTLPEASGITSTSTGNSCPLWHALHPFLTNYQTADGPDACLPTGETGEWNAVTGFDPAWTQWTIDLSGYATAGAVEVSLTYASDDTVQGPGVALDDIVVSTGEGNTSFEADDDPLDGWTVSGPPEGSPGNDNDWVTAMLADLPPSPGDVAAAAFARQPEIIDFLAGYFGTYPFSAAGGIVDDVEGLGFALENQTRPIYALDWFSDAITAEGVIVHELAHQWFGDNLRLGLWQDIWLNEGFATYAEWLWSEREGLGTAQEIFDFYMAVIPADDPFWTVVIGDPGPDLLFDIAVYYRGAMTLHALRLEIGDENFFRLIRTWADQQAGDTVFTPEFIALAEQISGQELDDFFETWLYTPAKPDVGEGADVARSTAVLTTTAGRLLHPHRR